MHFICLCPTYGRPSLVRNALALFLGQDLLPDDTAHLFIFDDAGQLPDQDGHQGTQLFWTSRSVDDWGPLPRKYDRMLATIGIDHDQNTVYVVWDDDDVYLPWHLRTIGEALQHRPDAAWFHPVDILSTYGVRDLSTDDLLREKTAGRFHGTLALRGSLLSKLNGWPDTDLATYDQQMLAACRHAAGDPAHPKRETTVSYVYRWGDTGKWHCSGSIDQAGQYARPPIQEPGNIETLTPAYDASTRILLARLAA